MEEAGKQQRSKLTNFILSGFVCVWFLGTRPTPSIKWERKDASFSSTKAAEERFGRWLEFTSISESDDGEYTCTASNIMGQAKHSYTVTVEGN